MIKELRDLLRQIQEPDTTTLVEYDSKHPTFHIWRLKNARLKDLDLKFREFRPEHARFDIFINGQYILEQDYIFEQEGPDILIKFKKANFAYTLNSNDKVLIKGDIQIDD
tara:strand:- start:6253 stop:6582 length:330 start_codon:yes stop_codon:yes gene_type:complete